MTQELQDAFISYGRADSKAFATQLHQRLTDQGFRVWFDQNDIPLGVDFQDQIDTGIETSDNFLFIIAPHSINSIYCGKEIELALRRHKRIIPLLHVEQITQEIWAERFPNRSSADWHEYQAKGLDSSFANMHPAIGKINWVYFREGIDDFERSFAGLLELLDRHRDYVHQHTQILTQALGWERQHKQPRYLLTGKQYQQAATWLQLRFSSEQPPCTPTDLHCELITESSKYAKNQMTQVFLSYSEADLSRMEQVRQSLRRSGFTVWTNKTDIQTGMSFEEAIRRGIEEADNLVYLLSPDALQSPYCQQELDYALSLHKRVIPLLVRSTSLEQAPAFLRTLQYIDLTDNTIEADYAQDEKALIKALRQDQSYYETHKLLLVKALRWQQQQQSSSLLLRGGLLRRAEAWLKVGKQCPHPPTPLQASFIRESLDHPPGEALDVFISYAEADADFAQRLNDALQLQGKTTCFETETQGLNPEVQSEVRQGIETSNSFLCVVSPDSLDSSAWGAEVDYAQALNKRIVTVLRGAVPPIKQHPALELAQTVDFTQHRTDFSTQFSQLMQTLDTDLEHLQAHTRLLVRAIEWQRQAEDESFLLRGSDLTTAEQWLKASVGKQPIVTELQQTYILTGQQAETARQAAEIKRQQQEISNQRFWLRAVALISVLAVGAALWAVKLFQDSKRSQVEAAAEAAEVLFFADNQLEAMVTALWAAKQTQEHSWLGSTTETVTKTALTQILYGISEQNRFVGHAAEIWAVRYSPDGQTLISASADGTAKIWSREGQLLTTLAGHGGKVMDLSITTDGQTIATASTDKTAKIWSRDGKVLATLTGHTQSLRRVSFSPDGKTIATASNDKTVRLWNRQGKVLKVLTGHQGAVRSTRFSPDGQLLATASADGTAKLWRPDGTLVTTLTGHTEAVNSVTFSPDGQTIATASNDNTVKLWRRNGTLQTTLLNQAQADVYQVRFSPDGKLLAMSGADNAIHLRTAKGELVRTFKGHNDSIYGLDFSPDGKTLVSASGDRTLRLWEVKNSWVTTLADASASVYSLRFSPDGKAVIVGTDNGSVFHWSLNGKLLNAFTTPADLVAWAGLDRQQRLISVGDNGSLTLWKNGLKLQQLQLSKTEIRRADFSPDRQVLALANIDKTVQLWDLNGTLLKTLQGHQGVVRGLSFSPDGQTLAAGDETGRIYLWESNGRLIKQMPAHQGAIRTTRFSQDGQVLATSGDDRVIRLWSRDGALLNTLTGHTDTVRDLVFSPNSQFLASGSDDRTVRLWQRDGSLLRVLKAHTGPVMRLHFSADGKLLASGSGDNMVKLWNLDHITEHIESLPELIATSCNWLRPYLSHNSTLSPADRDLCSSASTPKP